MKKINRSVKKLLIVMWLVICAVLGMYLPQLPIIKEFIQIKVVKVKGTDRLKKENVAKYFANQNWFFIDEDIIEAKMKNEFPFIKNIEVQRLFVGEIRLVILEREPFAILKIKKKKFIIDEEGVILSYYKVNDKKLIEVIYKDKIISPKKIFALMQINETIKEFTPIEKFVVNNRKISCIAKDGKILVFDFLSYKDGLENFKVFAKKVDINQYRYINLSYDSMVVSRR